MARRVLIPALLLALAPGAAFAQPTGDPGFGMEFEFAGSGNRIVRFEEMPFENYRAIMKKIVEYYGGRASDIRRVDFTKPTNNLERYPTGERPLFRAEWTDPKGRKWLIEPEYVASSGFDGYELVTPPMEDAQELREVVERVRNSGLVREGRRSGVHLTVDGSGLVKRNGNARALANLIIMHENFEPMLRRMFNPIRGGGHANYFARSLMVDHPELIREIDRLAPAERTRANLEAIFGRYNAAEAALHEVERGNYSTEVKPWKYRAMNLAKALNVNEHHNGRANLVEFRMFDLADAETHGAQAEFYRKMVRKALELAARGETVKLNPRPRLPAGENIAVYHTPDNVAEARAKAREMIEFVGADPQKFENVIERNVKVREHRTPTEFREALEALPSGRIVHNGKPMTYGFELEGRGAGLVNIARPTDATVNRRWNRMSEAERKAYYNEVVGEAHSSVKNHFRLDTAKHPWLSDYWYVEGSGNWEIHSKVMENLSKISEAMRTAKKLTGSSGKGFHLHMRDNAPNWETLEARGSQFADWIERASNWVYLKRVERLRTDLSLKSWSNARLSPDEIRSAAELMETDRATIRIAGVERGGYGSGEYIDLEIRGFTKYVEDIETLGRIFSNGLKTQEFGPWRHTENVMESEAWGSTPETLRYTDHMERYLAEVEGKRLTPEKRAILEGLQEGWADRAGGETRAYPTGVATPLLPWHNETALSEVVRRSAKFAGEEYLGWLNRYTDKIAGGKYGLDMAIANETALEKLGLNEAEARAAVGFRRGGGTLNAASAMRAAAMRSGSEADARKAAKVDAIDLNTAEAEALRERLGLSEAEARRLIDYRTAHDAESSLKKAGLNAARRRTVAEKAEVFDIGRGDVTAEMIRSRTGLSKATSEAIVAFRDAHEVTNAESLKKAGLDAEEVREVMELVSSGIDISNLRTPAELAEALGISEAKAEALLEAAKARRLRSFNDVLNAGLSEAAKERLRSGVRTLNKLNAMTVEELMVSGRLTRNQAEKLVRYRDAMDIRAESVLKGVLGEAAGARAHTKIHGFNPATASVETMERVGVDWEVSRRIANYRDANLIGRGSGLAGFEAERAVEDLREADVIEWNESEKLERAIEKIDLETAGKNELIRRLGLTEAQAKTFLAFRDANRINAEGLKKAGFSAEEARRIVKEAGALNLRNARIVDIVNRTGLSRSKAERLKRLANLSYGNATVEAMVEAGLNRASAERLVAFREAAGNAEGMNYKKVVRDLRLRVREWVRESGLSEALLESLLPRPEVEITRSAGRTGEGFANVRRVATTELVPSKMSYETVAEVFRSVREGAYRRTGERLAAAETDAVRGNVEEGRKALESLKLEIVETNDILADRKGERVRVSTGLLNEIHAKGEALPPAERPYFRERVLGLIFGHETAHASGLKAEKLADIEAIRILERSEGVGRTLGMVDRIEAKEIRAAVEVFDKPTGASRVDNLFNRLRNLKDYGTTRSRTERLETAARGEMADKLAPYRRADGTLDWKRLTKDRVLREGTGVAHFALALFLKELAVVARSGDRARMEEFFEGLLTTDFYKEYGLFVAGARIGEVAYVRYLQRYVKPRFVSGILKANLVLATGLALPSIVRGDFTAKTFAISLGSLGLSSAAVKTGMAGIKWVIDLKKAKQAGTLARTGLAASRFAKLGGWFYTAVELAIILYIAEDIEHAVTGYLDREAAREALAAAGRKYLTAINDPHATPESVAEATDAYHAAWTSYRDFLYRPLHEDEAMFAARLETAAREAKLAADRQQAALKNIANRPALLANIERRFGSLDAYAAHLAREAEQALQEKVSMYADSYNTNRETHLAEVYEEGKRNTDILDGVTNLSWHLRGGADGAAGDPFAGRSDVMARLGRWRARSSFDDALENASANRLETYGDERSILNAAAAALRDAGRGDLADAIDERGTYVDRELELDTRLYHGNGMLDPTGTEGAATAVERALEGE